MTSKADTKTDQWTHTNTALEILYIAVALTDWAQTQHIAAHPDRWRELNPILGDHTTRNQVDRYSIPSL